MLKYSLIIFLILIKSSWGVPVNKFKVPSENAVEKSENALDESEYYDDSSEDVSTGKTQKTRADLELKAFEKRLEDYLDWYYEKYINPENQPKLEQKDSENEVDSPTDPHDQMQSDQPVAVTNLGFNGNGPFSPSYPLYANLSALMNVTKYSEETHNFSDSEYYDRQRNRRDIEVEDRTKDLWIQVIKGNVLNHVGRVNNSASKINEEIERSILNITKFIPDLHIFNESLGDDQFVTQKIRSYYPSCEIPRNTDQEVWKDENTMNLYFNVDHGPEENGISIATATLRLYRLPHENSSVDGGADSSCENSSVSEDDKLLRISIYWYTKSLKKHRVKRRLSDSKVIGETAKWVELSVRPATRAWTKGRNLGLAILVEDQDGTVLKADKYFKGASCMQPQNLSQPSLLMQQQNGQMNWNEVMAILEEIQQQPCLTTYHCFQK